MTRHLRNRDIGSPDSNSEEEGHIEGFKDDNGVVHTTTRSLRKINYAEIEHGLDYLDKYDDDNDTNGDDIEKRNENPSSNTNTTVILNNQIHKILK